MPTQIGKMVLPCVSLRMTMGMLVTGSIIRPRMRISTSMATSPYRSRYHKQGGRGQFRMLSSGGTQCRKLVYSPIEQDHEHPDDLGNSSRSLRDCRAERGVELGLKS